MTETQGVLQLDRDEVFEKIFKELYPGLCAFACKYVNDGDVSADIVQDSFVRCWERRADFDSILRLRSFLYTVVRNISLNFLRDHKRRLADMPSLESETFFLDNMLEEESYRLFYQAVEALPDRTREVIYCSLKGMKNSEIATHMNIGEETVHTLKRIAYKKLKRSLGENNYMLLIFFFPAAIF